MTTFTASEVVAKLRERFTSGNSVPVPDIRLARAEFDVIADRLEADEKSHPIYQLMATDDSWWDVSRELYEAEGSHAGRTRILYTHPAPADAERLAEALERTARHRAAADRIDPDQWRSVLYSWEDRALAAHSAQAQPPAQSKYAPPYPDQSDEWAVVPRVPTKAMIDACCKIKLDRLEALRDGHGASSGIVAAVQEEWAAMIAAAPRKRIVVIGIVEAIKAWRGGHKDD